ncbi:DUF1835 domain-containing protein [Chitinophaga nivalis]|uniref:DUF1835 domain-containing protein n=1 Tax=Chitinophaga nivalis TaxID=2991709 RepID=A0ABT3IHR1_9BACT|nr:DUF1835 domain-containing protein [Chitinophaga nivalis]MCW3466809.1 DUF1835 domain-containing protein [Chitinophaga nivalis]MCW3483500.1 DUF1835 domain-containing protein [Chitinophaga nivalis]
MLHIVFGQPAVTVLGEAVAMDEKMQGEILYFEDDLSVGPLFILDTKDGQAARKLWWQQLAGIQPQPAAVTTEETAPPSQPVATPEEEETPGDADRFRSLKARLKEEPELEVWIWAGQNARDVCGYYWLVSQLYDFAGRIHIIYLNNLPFLNEKGGVFYPTHLHQILPKEFLKAKKLARPISLAEYELDGEEWHRLMNENGGIRLLEGGKKIRGEATAFYDKELVTQSGKEFVKAWKVVQQVTGKLKYPVMDQFLGWRLKELIREGKLESKGELKTIRDFEVKLPGEQTINETAS